MCITVAEMNETMKEIQSLKRLKEETEDAIKALEAEVIGFLKENKADYKTTNKSGKEILQFIGNVHKATYSDQTRETVDTDFLIIQFLRYKPAEMLYRFFYTKSA